MVSGEGHVGQDIRFGVVHKLAELGPARAELVGDVAPGGGGAGVVGLDEGLPDRGRDHGGLRARDMGHAWRMKGTRQRCQVAPAMVRVMAAFRPAWASEITSRVPDRPHFTRLRGKSVQKGLASEGPIWRPTISRRP